MVSPAEAVTAIVEREFPDAAAGRVTPARGGRKTTVLVDLPDGRVAVSLCDDPAHESRFAVEPRVMELVRRETGLPVPAVLARDLTKRAVPYMYFVAQAPGGYDPRRRYKYLPRRVRERLLVRAGAYLGELHARVELDAVGPLRPDDGGVAVEPEPSWPAFLERSMREWSAALDGGRFEDLRPTFEAVADDCSTVLDGTFAPVLLHFDYRPANLLVRDGEVVAVLDWGLARAGHAEYDFFKFEKNFLLAHFETPAIRDALREYVHRGYRSVHGLDPGWRRRRAFYRVAYKLESVRSFPRWTRAGADLAAVESKLRDELATDLARLRDGST